MKVAVKEFFPRELVTRDHGTSRVIVYDGDAKDYFSFGLDKFIDEARTLARFHGCPGIASVINYFGANGTGYMVMNYLEGLTFREFIDAKEGKRIPFELARDILMPVMDTLREVHGTGLLHRDVSPDNIYITYNRQVKLLDFGAARFAIGERSRSLTSILRPGYAPKEQYSSREPQGPWTDIYAVGATFYRAVTGQVPPEALDRAVRDDIVPPRRLGVHMSSQDESALMKSLAVRAADRFQNVPAFQSALAIRVPERVACPACNALTDPQATTCSSCGAALRMSPEPAGPVQYAGFGRRAGAFLIDSFVTTIAAWMMFLVLAAASNQNRMFGTMVTSSPLAFLQGYYPSYQPRHNDDTLTVVAIVTLMMIWIVNWLYSSLMESSAKQGTLGKIATGLAVTGLKGERISFLRAAARYFLKSVLSLCGVGYLAAAVTENRQALHDMIAGTVVIVKPRSTAIPR
jgi:serine/threonine protein kinase